MIFQDFISSSWHLKVGEGDLMSPKSSKLIYWECEKDSIPKKSNMSDDIWEAFLNDSNMNDGHLFSLNCILKVAL